jgi:hypothetical protein
MSNTNNNTKTYKAGDLITIERPPKLIIGQEIEVNGWYTAFIDSEGYIPALNCDLFSYEYQGQYLILAAPEFYNGKLLQKDYDPKELTLKVLHISETLEELREYTKHLLQEMNNV